MAATWHPPTVQPFFPPKSSTHTLHIDTKKWTKTPGKSNLSHYLHGYLKPSQVVFFPGFLVAIQQVPFFVFAFHRHICCNNSCAAPATAISRGQRPETPLGSWEPAKTAGGTIPFPPQQKERDQIAFLRRCIFFWNLLETIVVHEICWLIENDLLFCLSFLYCTLCMFLYAFMFGGWLTFLVRAFWCTPCQWIS